MPASATGEMTWDSTSPFPKTEPGHTSSTCRGFALVFAELGMIHLPEPLVSGSRKNLHGKFEDLVEAEHPQTFSAED